MEMGIMSLTPGRVLTSGLRPGMDALYGSVIVPAFRSVCSLDKRQARLRMQMPRVYVVFRGRVPGVYAHWEQCHKQVTSYSGNSYKSYSTIAEAEAEVDEALARGT